MSVNDQKETPLEVADLQGNSCADDLPKESIAENNASTNSGSSWAKDIEQTIQLGQQFAGVIGGIVDLARVEATLAISTFPKVLMLWLLMMPIMLLTWCAFSALIAWSVYAASEEMGLGILAFFLLQVFLLVTCRWWYAKYRTYMTLPFTRAHIDNFVRSTQHALNSRGKEKE